MKTDELVNVLSTNLEVVNTRRVFRELAAAVMVGTVAVLAFIFFARGIRPDIRELHALLFISLKVSLGLGVVTGGLIYLVEAARPGGGRRFAPNVSTWLVIAVALLAIASLTAKPLWHWHTMAMTDGWLECLVSIPFIAIVPFAVVVWALRRMAPTDLVRAGALAGFVASGISIIGYALHCTGDSVPFITIWYGGTLLLCTMAGALLGPRLLRW